MVQHSLTRFGRRSWRSRMASEELPPRPADTAFQKRMCESAPRFECSLEHSS